MSQIQAQPLLGLNSLLFFLKVERPQAFEPQRIEAKVILQIRLQATKFSVDHFKCRIQKSFLYSPENSRHLLR